MLQITFLPEARKSGLIQAAEEYESEWTIQGSKIQGTMEEVSGLLFQTKSIEATVFEGISQSHPLKLRASYDRQTKRGCLIHELCHILIVDNANSKIKLLRGNNVNLVSHQQIYLILYDIWVDLYGEKFADEQVEVESQRSRFYQDAWHWALSKTKEERKAKFDNLKIF
jgi:hypothetical protein